MRRKTPGVTLEAYARAFTPQDRTLLAMRTSRFIDADLPIPEGPERRRYLTSWATAGILHRNAPAPRTHLISDRITFEQIAGMHVASSGWISLPHSEGWDLGCFDAAVAGCPVITTAFGGPLAYLDPQDSFLIPGPVVDCAWLPGGTWMEPDLDAAVDALRSVRADPAAARERAGRQAQRLRERYAPTVVAAELVDGLSAAGILS
jgi:glycosyltransferase involved in cell wall biosynthesis